MTETKTKQTIRSGVQEHFASAELSDEQIGHLQRMESAWLSGTLTPQEKLQAMKEQITSRSSGSTPSEKILSIQETMNPDNMPSISASYQYQQPTTSKTKWLPFLLVGALLLGVLGWVWSQSNTTSKQGIAPALLQSVTTYHSQHRAPQTKAHSLTLLQQKPLKAVKFNTINSTHLPSSQWLLLGGSVTQYHQQPVVVLYYRHRTTGKNYTLHQTAPWSKLSKLKQAWTGTHNQTSLKVWQESGLLLVLVGP